MKYAETIKVTIETVMNDGERSVLVFNMDPFRFKLSQDREVKPVYDSSDPMHFGKPVAMEVDPNRRGTKVTIDGFVKSEKAGL